MSSAAVPARRTAQQLALDHMRRRISEGSLAPEAWIRQEHIAEEVGTSVVPIREALKILEAEGQVLYVPHRGYQVRRLGIAELVETYRLRQLLEDEAVRLASPRIDEPTLQALANEAAIMEAASARGDLAVMTEANRRFHFLIYDAAGMPRMSDFIRQLWQSTDAYRTMYYGDLTHRNHVNAEHRLLIGALRESRVDDTIALLRQHRDGAVESLRRVIEDRAGKS